MSTQPLIGRRVLVIGGALSDLAKGPLDGAIMETGGLERLIRLAQDIAQRENISPDRFDFEMLFGVRRDLQLRLVEAGYRVRVYLPYGQEWYPYLVRRLAERPANLGFFVRSLVSEALAGRRNGHP